MVGPNPYFRRCPATSTAPYRGPVPTPRTPDGAAQDPAARDGAGRNGASPDVVWRRASTYLDAATGALPPVVLAIVVVAVGSLVAATIVGELSGGHGAQRGMLVLDIGAGAAGLALLALLYRRPVPTTLALAVLSVVSPALVPTSTVAIVQVARVRPLRTALLVALPGILGHVLRDAWRPSPGLTLGWYALLACAVYAALVAWGARSRIRAELVASLRLRVEAAEAEQARLVAEARRAERTRMAREMHDGLAHRLSMITTHAGALEFRPDASPDRIAAAAAVVRTGLHEAMDELREVILLLREDPATDPSAELGSARQTGVQVDPRTDAPTDPATHPWRERSPDPVTHPSRERSAGSDRHPLPTLADLPSLVAELERIGMTIRLELGPETSRGLPLGASRAAYRIVQEALTNARRHAPGQPVHVAVGGQPGGRLTLEITNPMNDTTAAPTSAVGTGFGLVGLHERAELAGGALKAGSARGEFRVRAWLPWADGATGARAAR